ncbi:MAG: 16S rRNA (cytosine(1402)-N(4))-methyltransferase RsmH [Ilumatobacteraceae bacterium]
MNDSDVIDGLADAGFSHQPVMVHEIVEAFAPVPAGFVFDATVGGAGHAEALLRAHAHLGILAIDRDAEALEAAKRRLAPFGNRANLQHRRFDDVDAAVEQAGLSDISGALFDLGVSSFQFDTGRRGFSYRHDAPLDMRMDLRDSLTASIIVNEWSDAEIAEILQNYGDERFAWRIARSMVAARPIRTTGELAAIVAGAIPAPARRRGGHPAKRTFQALRIAVNRELEILPTALDRAIGRTAPGGRVLVLSYHSGEDRLVKERFAFHVTGGCSCPEHLPCACGARPSARRLRLPSRPTESERAHNPRSSSARLRAIEVL